MPEAARIWMRQEVSGTEAQEIASAGVVLACHYIWHPVTGAVGKMKNQGQEHIESVIA